MLMGMIIMFILMCAGLGTVAWLAWSRLGAHLKGNEEAVTAITKHVLIPLMGKKRTEE
jgi:hypothetical protein